jgi:hypothetical protein
MPSKGIHAAVEIAETTGKVADRAETVAKTASVIALPLAFRKYSWLHNKPLMNTVGDLRGIVINARARSVYEFAIKGQHLAANISTFATIASALLSVYDESAEIVASKDDYGIKAAKLSAQVTSVSLQVITGSLIVPEVLTLTHAISSGCQFAANWFPNQRQTLTNVQQFANDYSTGITTTVQTFTDGKNIYNNLQTVVVPYWESRLTPVASPRPRM